MTFQPAVFTSPGNTHGFVIKTNKESLKMSFSDIIAIFLISNFRCVLNVVFFLLGDSSVSEFYMPAFRNTYNPVILPAHTAYEDRTECSETSAYKIQTPWNHPKERIQQSLFILIIVRKTPKYSMRKCGIFNHRVGDT